MAEYSGISQIYCECYMRACVCNEQLYAHINNNNNYTSARTFFM